MGLVFNGAIKGELVGYADANWAGDLDTHRSTTDYLFFLNGSAISWKSKRQSTVATSSTEAECMNMCYDEQGATLIYQDNQCSIALAKNPVYHTRTKHIDIKFHFLREKVERGNIRLEYKPTDEMIADGMAKAPTRGKHDKYVNGLGMKPKQIRIGGLAFWSVEGDLPCLQRVQLRAVELEDEDVPDVQGVVGRGLQRRRCDGGQGAASVRDDCAEPEGLATDERNRCGHCEGCVSGVGERPPHARHGEPAVAQVEVRVVQVHRVLYQGTVMELETLVLKMRNANCGPSEEDVCATKLRSLRASYESLVQAFRMSMTTFSLADLVK
ncbi:hypothetical protein ON010_g18358 [Phytophthora cinnamomi]|nr:hypothetical protein ON010_g18358 [Phytophthora cinnamomi]